MNDRNDIVASLKRLMGSQKYAVLATEDQGRPYVSLMAYAPTEDGKQVVMVTRRNTRKHQNLKRNGRVALLIDDRENEALDTQRALAVTILGNAREVEGDERRRLVETFLLRHPQLRDLAESPSSAVMLIVAEVFQVVTRFEDVLEWHV